MLIKKFDLTSFKGSITPNKTLANVLNKAIETSDKDVLNALDYIHNPLVDHNYKILTQVDHTNRYAGIALMEDHVLRNFQNPGITKSPKYSREENFSAYLKRIESLTISDAITLIKKHFNNKHPLNYKENENMSAKEICQKLKIYKDNILKNTPWNK